MTHPTLAVSRQLLLSAVLALSGLAASSVYADSHAPGAPQHHGMGNLDMGPQTSMANNLNLNDKQRELYKTAMGLKMQSMQGAMALHEELREITQSDNYSEQKVRELVAKHQKESEEKIVKSSNAMNEFYKSLSPEQKAKLNEMHKNRKEKMKERVKDGKEKYHEEKKQGNGKNKSKPEDE